MGPEVGLHKGPNLSSSLFASIMDCRMIGIQYRVPCILVADDVVLVSQTRKRVNIKLNLEKGV